MDKSKNVIYRRGSRPYEEERSATPILSLPLLEQYDRVICALRAENEMLKTEKSAKDKLLTVQYNELLKVRAEAFHLREELKLLRDEVAQGRLPVDPIKNTVKFNAPRKSYWEVDKSTRSKKRRRIRELVTNAVEKLPVEFKPVEVS